MLIMRLSKKQYVCLSGAISVIKEILYIFLIKLLFICLRLLNELVIAYF